MSVKNRKKQYEKLKAAGRLDHDDGALVKEFGMPMAKPLVPNKPKTEKPKGGK